MSLYCIKICFTQNYLYHAHIHVNTVLEIRQSKCSDYFKGANSDHFKGTDSVLKVICAALLKWDIRSVTWLNPIESLWRGSLECNV